MTINSERYTGVHPENFKRKKITESTAATPPASPSIETTPEQKRVVEKIMQDAGYFDTNGFQTPEKKVEMWRQISQIRPLSPRERNSQISANQSLRDEQHLEGEFEDIGQKYISRSGQRLASLKQETPEVQKENILTKNNFDILSAQQLQVVGSTNETWSMSAIAREYTKCTHEIMEKIKDADMVIYLDKSARPVEWLVKAFWPDDGSEPPAHKFLNIDRVKMFREMSRDGTPLFGNVYENGQVDYWQNEELVQPEMSPGQIQDYLIKPNPTLINGIRALFVQGEIPQDEGTWQNAVSKLPTGLEGKKVVIVDEVKSSGLTIKIAEALIRAALGEQVEVSSAYFWNSRHKRINGAFNMTSLPVWYDNAGHHSITQGVRGLVKPITNDEKNNLYDRTKGRLVGDQAEDYYTMIYEEHPSSITFAQKKAAAVLSAPHLKEQQFDAGVKPNDPELYAGDIDALKLKHDIELLAFAVKNKIKII